MRALLISPHFPPINAADHQRVRMALPFFQEFGWEATVLAVAPEQVEGAVRDQRSEESLPKQTEVIRTGAFSYHSTRRIGLGSLAIRSYNHLQKAGDALLARNQFDVIFFSTTQFPVMALGRRWLKKFGVPYVLDFQDPWRNDYYERTGIKPPGGKLKYAFASLQARVLEPYSVRGAAHIITVSPAYVAMLRNRYPDLGPKAALQAPSSKLDSFFTVLPFGAAETDFEFLRKSPISQPIFSKNDGKQHWLYVGVCGDVMKFSLRTFFLALKKTVERTPELRNRLQLHFVGTDYAPPDRARKTVEPIAIECGVGDMVVEQTSRIPYFEAMQCLLDADALMVFGSDDPGYTASKINPYIVANKPLLAIFHEQSSVVELLRKTRAGTVIPFQTGEKVEVVVARILETKWIDGMLRAPCSMLPSTNWTAFAPYTAREMTRKLCEVFESVKRRRSVDVCNS